MEDEISNLYIHPAIGASNTNTYGEENIKNLLEKYRSLKEPDSEKMIEIVKVYSQSGDLISSFVSVAVLHALGMNEEVDAAYDWAKTQNDARLYSSHFDIGIYIADYLNYWLDQSI